MTHTTDQKRTHTRDSRVKNARTRPETARWPHSMYDGGLARKPVCRANPCNTRTKISGIDRVGPCVVCCLSEQPSWDDKSKPYPWTLKCFATVPCVAVTRQSHGELHADRPYFDVAKTRGQSRMLSKTIAFPPMSPRGVPSSLWISHSSRRVQVDHRVK